MPLRPKKRNGIYPIRYVGTVWGKREQLVAGKWMPIEKVKYYEKEKQRGNLWIKEVNPVGRLGTTEFHHYHDKTPPEQKKLRDEKKLIISRAKQFMVNKAKFERLARKVRNAKSIYYLAGVNIAVKRKGIGTRFKIIIERIAKSRGGGLMYTDTANPTNKRILKKLGWEPMFSDGWAWFYFKSVRGH